MQRTFVPRIVCLLIGLSVVAGCSTSGSGTLGGGDVPADFSLIASITLPASPGISPPYNATFTLEDNRTLRAAVGVVDRAGGDEATTVKLSPGEYQDLYESIGAITFNPVSDSLASKASIQLALVASGQTYRDYVVLPLDEQRRLKAGDPNCDAAIATLIKLHELSGLSLRFLPATYPYER
ncbi:MAG: hypothetical protein ACPGYV_11250 [Phycisphaeraceae bacterium]